MAATRRYEVLEPSKENKLDRFPIDVRFIVHWRSILVKAPASIDTDFDSTSGAAGRAVEDPASPTSLEERGEIKVDGTACEGVLEEETENTADASKDWRRFRGALVPGSVGGAC